MKEVFHLLLTAIAFLVASKITGPEGFPLGLYLCLLVYLALFPLGRLFPTNLFRAPRRFFWVFLIPLLATSIPLIWRTYLSLEPEVGPLAQHPIFQFFTDPPFARVASAFVGGGIASGTLLLLVYLSVAFFSAELVLAVYDGFGSGISRWDAIMGSLSLALGINRPTQVVTGGKLATTRQAAGSMTRFGGPGLLVVEDGNAVVLMRRGSVTRIVGPGLYGLDSFERVNMVVPLKTIFADAPLNNVATRDGLLIKKLNLLVFANVGPGDNPPVGRASFAFSEDNIRKLWRNFVGTVEVGAVLKDVIGSIANTSVRAVIAKYTLDEIFVPEKDGATIGVRERIKEEAAQAINAITDRFLAIKVGAVDIGEIEIAVDAQERLFQYWKADWDQRVSRTQARTGKSVKEIEAEAERLAMITKAKGTAESIRLIEEKKREAVEVFVQSMLGIATKSTIAQRQLLRFLAVVEEMCKRVMYDDLTARSYIEALENMAKGEGARIVLSGGSQPNLLIGLGDEPAGGKQ